MKAQPISAVICTKDNPARVIELVDTICNYIDEILIIDSSIPENFGKLSKKLPGKARLYNFPSLGYADPFFKIGADLAKNDWILLLADDETPDKELLENLKTNDDIACYLLLELQTVSGFKDFRPRLYNRKKIHFTGVVHWAIIPKGKLDFLQGNLYHYEHPSFDKSKRYALLDSYMVGFKILWIVNNEKWHPLNDKRNQLAKIFKRIFEKQFLFGKTLGWFLAIIEYLLSHIIYGIIRGNIKARLNVVLYNLFIFCNIVKNFKIKIQIWESLFKASSLNAYLDLNNPEDFEKLSEKGQKGLGLIISLIEEKARCKKGV